MTKQSLPKIFAAIYALLLCANISQAQVTEVEPNNTPQQANTLPFGGYGNGALNIAGDIDWWKVTTNVDGKLYITLDNTGNPDSKRLSLYDTAGTILLASGGIGNGIGGISMDGLATGTFFIKINGSSGNETGAYKLSDSLVPSPKPNDIEPNDNITHAKRLLLNDSTTGHLGYYYNNHRDTSDWYKVTTTSDGMLELTFDNTYQNDIKTILLYDTTGSPQLASANVGNGIGGLQFDGLAAGTYYIQLTNNGGNNFGPYTLSDSLITSPKPNDIEPNDNITQAKRLLLNDSTTGHLGYYYDNHRDTSDWYKVTTTNDGLLKLTFDNTYQYDIKTIILYDTTGSPQLASANVGNGIGSLKFDGLAAGTYYIQLTNNGGNNFGPYTLSDSLVPAWKPNDNEPNDNFSEAETLALNDSTTGHYGYYYYSRRDTSDWYKINITNRGKLKLTLDNTGNADLVTLNLYDASGTNKISSKNVGNGIGQLFSDTLAEGFYYIQLTNNGSNDFGPYSLTDTLYSALPVTFISFNGKINGNEALLNWSTVNEINNKGFEVQKSMDGQTFTDIGFVNGHGNSSQNNSYSYTDPKVISGSNYYRLKQIDNDGKYSYSSIIKVDYSQFDWAILGNPSNNMWVQVQLDKSANVTVQIVSMNGNIIQTINKGNLSAGTYSIPINLSGKSAGLYVVRLIVEGQFYSKKLVK